MATTLLQKARQRKMIYFGVIVALFTLSLVHREFIVKPMATRLQLRETTLGEVELTSSAVRLMLTGSRGLAVTILWYNAIEKQKRNEWNELELLVKSITKLQPYFITPWLYQSWNISFNVAVECDRPRDKYFYISRGLELLAEGERRNSGTVAKGGLNDPDPIVIPGNPELRHFMGFIYQLKIGNSDDQKTMRSLLELSCIDPIQRDPKRFLDDKGEIIPAKFASFAKAYPRLVRRLNEQLGYDNPKRVVEFLRENENIPNRFQPIDPANQANIKESALKPPIPRFIGDTPQFPILPPYEDPWPNPESPTLTNESIDVFLVCRTWYQYAQKPLPEPEDNPGPLPRDYDKLKHRVPKGMVIQIFRQYPARAQVYIAEALEAEGFFDADGWNMNDSFKKAFPSRTDHIYGTESKYHSRVAWRAGYEMYKDFGIKNGMYLLPAQLQAVNEQAKAFRVKFKVEPDAAAQLPPEDRDDLVLNKSYDAHMKLYFSKFYRGLVNLDSFLFQAEGESDDTTVAMRKKLFKVNRRLRNDSADPLALPMYREAWNLYLHTCFKHPRFAEVINMQEDLYEAYQKYLGHAIDANKSQFRGPVVLAAKIAYWPTPTWQQAIIQFGVVNEKANDDIAMDRVFPIRNRYGPFDMIQYYDAPHAKELKEGIFSFLQGANSAHNPTLTDIFPGRQYFHLVRTIPHVDETYPTGVWRPLIMPQARSITRDRLGLNR